MKIDNKLVIFFWQAEESADTTELTEGQLHALRECFDEHDYEGTGYIDGYELGDLLREAGFAPNDHFIQEKTEQHDQGDLKFTFEDVLEIVNENRSEFSMDNQKENLRQAFKVFDKDGNGYIDREEFKSQLQNLGEEMTEEEIDDLIARCDLDGDGKVHYEEFIKMVEDNPGAIHMVLNEAEPEWWYTSNTYLTFYVKMLYYNTCSSILYSNSK